MQVRVHDTSFNVKSRMLFHPPSFPFFLFRSHSSKQIQSSPIQSINELKINYKLNIIWNFFEESFLLASRIEIEFIELERRWRADARTLFIDIQFVFYLLVLCMLGWLAGWLTYQKAIFFAFEHLFRTWNECIVSNINVDFHVTCITKQWMNIWIIHIIVFVLSLFTSLFLLLTYLLATIRLNFVCMCECVCGALLNIINLFIIVNGITLTSFVRFFVNYYLSNKHGNMKMKCAAHCSMLVQNAAESECVRERVFLWVFSKIIFFYLLTFCIGLSLRWRTTTTSDIITFLFVFHFIFKFICLLFFFLHFGNGFSFVLLPNIIHFCCYFPYLKRIKWLNNVHFFSSIHQSRPDQNRKLILRFKPDRQ